MNPPDSETRTQLGETPTPLGETPTPLGGETPTPLGETPTPLGETPTPLGETPTPLRMTGPERRRQLLDVTRAIVGEAGFHAVSIEAVARRARISRPIVYGHFNDLSGLLEAMLERETARAEAQLARILPPDTWTGDVREALLGALRGYLEAVQADPVTWRLVLMPPEGAPEMLREQIGQARARVVAVLAELVRPGFAPGRPSPDPVLTARTLSTLADGAARLILTDPEEFSIDRVMEHSAWLLGQLVG